MALKNSDKQIAVISLGCDKNRVDTERMLFNLNNGGYCITEDYKSADAIIINTCAFINSAREEAIDTILSVAELKKVKDIKIIVTGCLPQKHLSELENDLLEADAFLGIGAYDTICGVLDSLFNKSNVDKKISDIKITDEFNSIKRLQSTPPEYAYLKIAEGCDNFCTYCTIPSIRGKYKSRTIESLVSEAEKLEKNGVKELIFVAQDVTRYGIDLYGKYRLVDLIKEISKLDFNRIRLMYLYPELITDELLKEVQTNPKVCKYLDIPLQHVSSDVLKRMGRRQTYAQTVALIEKIQVITPHIAVRTTFMTGFPGETEQDFNQLCDFIKKYKLQHVGVFAFSAEDGTPAARINEQIDEDTKIKRVDILGKLHYENMIALNKMAIGKTVKVLYEGIDYDRNMFIGRTEYQSPDIDTVVYFKADFADAGQFYNIKITDFDGYDLIGEKV